MSAPGARSRATGLVYFSYFLAAIGSRLFSGPGLAGIGEALWNVSIGIYAVLVVMLYRLFRPVNAALSAFAALVGLAGCVVMGLESAHLVRWTLSPLAFFGPYCALLGLLILRSRFVPRPIGFLLVLAGVGWVAVLVPALATHIEAPVVALGIVAELAFMLWLLVAGAPRSPGAPASGAPPAQSSP